MHALTLSSETIVGILGQHSLSIAKVEVFLWVGDWQSNPAMNDKIKTENNKNFIFLPVHPRSLTVIMLDLDLAFYTILNIVTL